MREWEQIAEETGLPAPDQKVFIWGAGNTSVLNHQGMLRENLYEELRVSAFLDTRIAGTTFNGFPVYHPDVLEQEDPQKTFVLISTTNPRVFQEIQGLCNGKIVSNALLDAVLLKTRARDFHEAESLFDCRSRSLYRELLSNRALASNPESGLYAGESYFGLPEFCRSSFADVIVDCGAYVGDSAERYLWRMDKFKKYIAIEPDIENYRAMQKRFKRLREEWNLPEEKLVALNAGVDEKTRALSVESRVGGLGSIACQTVRSGNETKPFWALDDLMPDGFTFLKADIESYEYRMLLGAEKSIKKHHPRMAVCIYHNMVDMYSIPQLIHRIDPSYHLAIRHHSYGYEETVLYAY